MTLQPNGLGGYLVRQSDLSAWSRCALQKHYYDEARENPDAPQPEALSGTVYGTVVHYALLAYHTLLSEGTDPAEAADRAVATFEHYWHPDHIAAVAEPITEWLPRQTYGGLRERGRTAIRDYARLDARDWSRTLAAEYQFAVPLPGDGVVHTLTGTVDLLQIRRHYTKPFLDVRDFKTGRQPTYLRYNMQGTAYAYATLLPEFWTGWPDSGVGQLQTFDPEWVERLESFFDSYGYQLVDRDDMEPERPLTARRFTWINLRDVKFSDGGWRNQRDYARLALAVDAYVRANEAGIYGLTTTGEVCRFCPFRKVCGGIGLPAEDEGKP